MQIFKTKKVATKALAKTNVTAEVSPFTNPDLPRLAHAVAVPTKVKKNRFQPESALRLLLSLASVSGKWIIEDFSDEDKECVILLQNTTKDPAKIVLTIEDEKVKLESVGYKMVQGEPKKSFWDNKPKPSEAVRTEVKKTLTASKRSELKHLEDHIISFS